MSKPIAYRVTIHNPILGTCVKHICTTRNQVRDVLEQESNMGEFFVDYKVQTLFADDKIKGGDVLCS